MCHFLGRRVFSLAHRIAHVVSYVLTADRQPLTSMHSVSLTILIRRQDWDVGFAFGGCIDESRHFRQERIIVVERVNLFSVGPRSSDI